jgi:hypothetical protein
MRRANFREFDVGSEVYVRTKPLDADGRQSKLAMRYDGPHVVLRKFSPVLYLLRMNTNKIKVWHAINMKY